MYVGLYTDMTGDIGGRAICEINRSVKDVWSVGNRYVCIIKVLI